MAEETKEIKLSADSKKVMEMVEKMSVLELAELVKAMEEKFGVSAAAPVAVAAAPAAGETAAAEEKANYDVVLVEAGATKIAVIKAVRELDPSLGLVDAKNLVEAAPKTVLEGAKKEDAEAAKTKLEGAGAKVELK
ncbi:50S ribosomal protein L7/L12 [candidate division WWE3 bacterium CG10_big_fil_rev_8_21_14_0_10_32_10]|uniref:Large ribosomal subunit protein bL12 n=1 Tax=candidate division WWE3 bacterium CG10_big_fil_rev_8_21_14_0_10_32_10 TaxID=1975090 RepID=A0A2H0R9M6_UNCKA|nr:MAG: 50S ribosomal protein L7/L12 [candidate division WWE3 bacterium CG10_big_fil_rev_8_21_14_0_10_32_10]